MEAMMLTEYINQECPACHPTVVLQEGEYEITGMTIGRPGITETRRYVDIPKIREKYGCSGYIQVGNEERLMTTDDHGNARNLTVFTIPKTPTA